jgi:hypothetical protein
MQAQDIQAYEARVSKMSRGQIEATLKNHDGMVGTQRWSGLGEQLRTDLLAMADILRSKQVEIAA